MSQIVLYFLYSTSVLRFYIDVVLTPFIYINTQQILQDGGAYEK